MQRWAKHGKSMKLLDFIYHTGRCEPCVKTNETKIKLYSKKYHVSMRKIGYFSEKLMTLVIVTVEAKA